MRLADFIENDLPELLTRWESFAATLLPAAGRMDSAALRDHAEQMLRVVAEDLRTPQSPGEQEAKSKGEAPPPAGTRRTAAHTHALLRASGGFTIQQLVAEYRALRASVLRQWAETQPVGPHVLEDIGRFNEAIDQAIAESVGAFAAEVDRWRHLFLGVLGHDLRGPLNAILLTSQQVSMLRDGEPTKEPAARLIRSGQRMKQLIDDLLDYSRTSLDIGLPVRPAPMDLVTACHEEIQVQQAAHPGCVIEFAVQGTTQGCWDGSRARQLVGNLVANAATYCTPGTPIKVALNGVDPEVVVLSVENQGETIPEPILHALFEPLRRGANNSVDEPQSHLGLGLFIVREVARAHGGSVGAISREGRTTFTAVLPRDGSAEVR